MAETVERLVATLEADITRFEKSMGDAVKTFEKSAGLIEARNKTLTSNIAKGFDLSGLTRALSAAAIIGFGKSVLETTGAIQNQAEQVGVNVEAFQAYVAILKDHDATQQQAEVAISRMTEKLGEAKDGVVQAREAFMKLGIDVNALIQMSPEQALQAVAKGALAMSDASERAAALAGVFGERVSRFLVPALGELAKGAEDNIAVQKELGRVMDEETIKRAAEAKEKLGQVWDRFVVAAAPAVAMAVDGMTKLIELGEELGKTLFRAFDHPEWTVFGPSGTFRKGTPADQAALNPFGNLAINGANNAVVGDPNQTNPGGFTPPEINITEGPLGKWQELHDALDQFAKDAQAALDEADQHIAEALQGTIDDITQKWDDYDQRFAEQQQQTADDIAKIWDEYDQHQAEAAQETVDEIEQRWDEYYQRQAELQQRLSDRLDSEVIDGLTEIGSAARHGFGEMEKAINRVVDRLADLALNDLIKGLYNGAGGTSGIFASIGSFLGISPRASGGPVSAGQPYLVGEKRPELFVPSTSGMILPQVPNVRANGAPTAIHLSTYISLDGANGDETVRKIVRQGVLEGMAINAANLRQQFPGLMQASQSKHL